MTVTTRDDFRSAIESFKEKNFEHAIVVCRQILLSQPDFADARQMIGLCYIELGQFDLAIEHLESSVEIRPDSPPFCINLGELYRRLGRLEDSLRMLERALRLQERNPEAAFNLGNTLRDLHRYPEAIVWFRRAVEWRPRYANAHLNLANLLFKEGYLKQAVEHNHQFLRFHPDRGDAMLSLGGAYEQLGQYGLAKQCYLEAEKLDPSLLSLDSVLGQAMLAEGNMSEALCRFQRIAKRQSEDLLSQMSVNRACDIVPVDNTSIDEYRHRLSQNLDRMHSSSLSLDLNQLHTSCVEPPMALAYHGRDDRPLKERYAEVFAEKITRLELRPRRGKPHVGIVVTNGHEGVFTECLGRLASKMADEDLLDVTIVCGRIGGNVLPRLIGDSRLKYLTLPDTLPDAAARLASAEIDLLHYWEIGTDSTNYFLPFFGAAPVQSACWGWPVTTGIPSVDYFVSSQSIEPQDGSQHYCEQLIQLESLPTWYLCPPVPRELPARTELGLPERERIYLCAQNLRKYQPDFDEILAELLRRDPEGKVYAIEDANPFVSRSLHARFEKKYPDVCSRFVMYPRQERLDYLKVVSAADVILDTTNYGGGANSLYDAFACGTPVVTIPGRFHRGRYAQAICRKLDLIQLIASSPEDYTTRAMHIARDRDYREYLNRAIRERSEVLFEDHAAVQQHLDFFLEVIERSRTS